MADTKLIADDGASVARSSGLPPSMEASTVMPEQDSASRPRPRRFLIAALCGSAAIILITAINLASPTVNVAPELLGVGRAIAALLWVFWFLVYLLHRFLSPEAVAYAIGFVHGVARRYPAEDKVKYLGR